MGLVGDLTHDPGRHGQPVVGIQQPGDRLDLVRERNLRASAEPVPEVPQQRLLPARILLDPRATQ